MIYLSSVAVESESGVFHSNSWDQHLSTKILLELIEQAKLNKNRKASLCLHPSPKEMLQVTYLAFYKPYQDKIHSHPNRTEVIIPIFGRAKHSIFDENGEIVSSKILDENESIASSTPAKVWHAIEVLSDYFLMLEIGTGPFNSESTVYR